MNLHIWVLSIFLLYQKISSSNACHLTTSCNENCPCSYGQCFRSTKPVFFLRESKCICHKGYEGGRCEYESKGMFCERRANWSFCKNKGECISDNNIGASCKCAIGFAGRYCQYKTCAKETKCPTNSICTESNKGAKCSCTNDFSGKKCDIPSSCKTNPCKNLGTCINKAGDTNPTDFECKCYPGYIGKQCEATSVRCVETLLPCNFGECAYNPLTKLSSCICNPGYKGTNCNEEDKGEQCKDSNKCNNGGTCIVDPETNEERCICHVHFFGERCEMVNPLTPCHSSPCHNGGSCFDITFFDYVCICVKNKFTGKNCEYPRQCGDNPCLNGGVCLMDENEQSNNYKCYCPHDYHGYNCEKKSNGRCNSAKCSKKGICNVKEVDGDSIEKCECYYRYTGEFCETSKYETRCDNTICNNNGNCFLEIVENKELGRSSNWEFCDCSANYTGSKCENNVVDCANGEQCLNGGTCTYGSEMQFYCKCLPGFIGPICEIDNNPKCDVNKCKNYGVCHKHKLEGAIKSVDGLANLEIESCNCLPEFYGDRCEINLAKVIDTNSRCSNGATFGHYEDNGQIHPYCFCFPGFAGIRCEQNLTKAKDTNSRCLNGATFGHYEDNGQIHLYCSCLPGFAGISCKQKFTKVIDTNSRCLNGATFGLYEDNGQFLPYCFCLYGFAGIRCEQILVKCHENRNLCSNGECTFVRRNEYYCKCNPGFSYSSCLYEKCKGKCEDPKATCVYELDDTLVPICIVLKFEKN